MDKLVAVEQLGQEDLDLLQGEVEANAHPLAGREGDIRSLVAVLDFLRVPAVRVEVVGVVPEFGVVVNVVEGRDNDGFFGELVAAWEDEVGLCCACGLEGWVVSSLGFFDVFVEECQTFCHVCCEFGVLVDIVVDELLEKTFLHPWVCDQAVNKPGQQRAGRCETCTGGHD